MIAVSPNEITILELAQPVKKLTESKSKMVRCGRRSSAIAGDQ
jgi:hypothetical protein